VENGIDQRAREKSGERPFRRFRLCLQRNCHDDDGSFVSIPLRTLNPTRLLLRVFKTGFSRARARARASVYVNRLFARWILTMIRALVHYCYQQQQQQQQQRRRRQRQK